MNSNERKASVGWETRQLEIDQQLLEETAGHVVTGNHATIKMPVRQPHRATVTAGEGLVELAGIEPATS